MPTIPWSPGPAAADPPAEVVVLASELRLRSLRQVPAFFRASMTILKQTKQAPGAVGVSLRAAPLRRTFWTLSSWESQQAIGAFVAAEPHRTVMKAMRPHMAGTVFTTWTAPADRTPDWPEADRRIDQQRRAAA